MKTFGSVRGTGVASTDREMPFRLRFGLACLAVTLSSLTVACDDEANKVSIDGTMRSDGYALFAVDNERQQRADVVVTVKDVDPNATYVLLYSAGAPRNVGWFLFDPSTTSRCGGDVGAHCEIAGYGYMVDTAKAAPGATEVILRDERCGCDADDDDRDWTGHWAVLRVERTDRANTIHFEVTPRKVESFTEEPDVQQLQ